METDVPDETAWIIAYADLLLLPKTLNHEIIIVKTKREKALENTLTQNQIGIRISL